MDIGIPKPVRRELSPHPEERPLGRVSKDEGYFALMVRDALEERAPHHEDFN
jgi:hypothetical protein